ECPFGSRRPVRQDPQDGLGRLIFHGLAYVRVEVLGDPHRGMPEAANAGNRLAQINHSNQAGLGRLRAGLEQMHRISGSVALRVVLFTNRNRTQSAPTDREYHRLRTANFAGTAYDPALFVAETTRHLADVSLGGQVQLSDGTHAYLRA